VPQLPKLQPSLPLQPTLPTPQLAKTEPPDTPGETYLKPKTNTPAQPPAPKPPPERPRTLKQAQAQQDQLPGPALQQAGGVARHALWSSLDAKAVPFGDYDRAIIEAVSQRWYDMLDSRRFAQDRAGKVILRFKMKPDGSIIEMQTLENTVGELLGYLCQEAIEEAAPFAPWPADMQRMIGTNYREITFTFYYY
jgi:outer membrane biosynthesis protein TonB